MKRHNTVIIKNMPFGKQTACVNRLQRGGPRGGGGLRGREGSLAWGGIEFGRVERSMQSRLRQDTC